MDYNIVYNASVTIAQLTVTSEDYEYERNRLGSSFIRHQWRSKSCSPVFPSDIPEVGDVEFSSFETALESPTSFLSEREPASSPSETDTGRKPRHRSVDIATLQEVANSIEIHEILDGCGDVQDEGAPQQMPNNQAVCYFRRECKRDVRTSPAVSISTVDTSTSLQSSPMHLPASSGAFKGPDVRLSDTSDSSISIETSISSALASISEDSSQEIETVEPCACGMAAHYLQHDPEMPIKRHPSFLPGSYEEALSLASAEVGHWVTILERSQSLDTHYKYMGLNYMKRAVMNRLAVPLTFFLENNETVIHVHVHTPIGVRHMHADITGKPMTDIDPDCGKWEGVTSVIDYSIPWFCNGTPVRALRQRRQNEKVGTVLETRCIIPDAEHGKIMLFNFQIFSLKDPNKAIATDRLLRLVRK